MEVKKQVIVKLNDKEQDILEQAAVIIGEMIEYSFDNKVEFSNFPYEDLDKAYALLGGLIEEGGRD